MAVSETVPAPKVRFRSFFPRWPARGIDLGGVWIDYYQGADELMLYFKRPVPAIDIPIDTPDRDYVYLRVDEETEEVVGVSVETFKLWATSVHPHWAPLADPAASPEQRRDAATALIAEAAGLFALHGAGAAEVGGA